MGNFRQLFPFSTTYIIDENKIVKSVKFGARIPEDGSDEAIQKTKVDNKKMLKTEIDKLF